MTNMKFKIEMMGFDFTTEDKEAYRLIMYLYNELVQEKRIVRALLDLREEEALKG